MLFYNAIVQVTPDKGKGLFIQGSVKKGNVIGILSADTKIITEEEYLDAVEKDNTLVIATGVRLIDKYFLCDDHIDGEEFINHSETPTMLYHCGMCFATRDLKPGDELTVNYKYFLPKRDIPFFIDNETGHEVNGLSAWDALIESTKELTEILSDL